MKQYRNLFAECGYSQEEIDQKVQDTWNKLFMDDAAIEKIYYTDDMGGYLLDTGNDDARSEGMSYGMMMAVQMDEKEVFDKIWAWSHKNMYHQDGFNKGYFAWHCHTDGTKIDDGPAPDGEEFFAMALFFAANRWGNGEGIYNYAEMARTILSDCLHKGYEREGHAMWDRDNYLIRFVPGVDFTDPSYHLPHFYELFAEWANEEDRAFWAEAAKRSRTYLVTAAHPETGLTPEYSYDDGTPNHIRGFGDFYSDSYRTAANIGMDYEWCGREETPVQIVENIHKFFHGVDPEEYTRYKIDGTKFDEKARHPLGLLATNAAASLAYDDGTKGKWFIDLLWNTPMRTDRNRYYDNCLYFFAILALSGNYRMWK